MKINSDIVLNVASKAASALAVAATAYDVHTLGVREAKIKRESNYADDFIAQQIGASKLNYPSQKHNVMKQWILDFQYPLQISEIWDAASGYVTGALKGIGYNIATLGFSALAFFGKKGISKKAGLFGLGISLALDFIKNSTNIFERTDYLRRK